MAPSTMRAPAYQRRCERSKRGAAAACVAVSRVERKASRRSSEGSSRQPATRAALRSSMVKLMDRLQVRHSGLRGRPQQGCALQHLSGLPSRALLVEMRGPGASIAATGRERRAFGFSRVKYASFVSAILFGSSNRCAPAGTRATAVRTRWREVLNHTCAKCAKLAIRHRGEQHQERARFYVSQNVRNF